jgi:hypothetical protein
VAACRNTSEKGNKVLGTGAPGGCERMLQGAGTERAACSWMPGAGTRSRVASYAPGLRMTSARLPSLGFSNVSEQQFGAIAYLNPLIAPDTFILHAGPRYRSTPDTAGASTWRSVFAIRRAIIPPFVSVLSLLARSSQYLITRYIW